VQLGWCGVDTASQHYMCTASSVTSRRRWRRASL
jgi:hypothetical protein